ncbi:MAG TPA: energy transducer TonB [Sphingomicrobium sp.]|nr:energy transducer TonB [Sphingomicrobium sp.]
MSRYRASPTRLDRAKAITAVIGIHAALVALILSGNGVPSTISERVRTTLIDIAEPLPPPPPIPDPGRVREEEGAAGKKAEPSPIVAPKPRIQLPAPTPLAAAPVAGTGVAPAAGAASAGTGPGAGGTGNGRGGGGTGGGGSPAQWIRGGLRDSDYPRELIRDRVAGMVSVKFTVTPSGSIANCRIARSSGSGMLDHATCSLLTQRLRFRPATDGNGRPVATEIGSDYTWGVRQRY